MCADCDAVPACVACCGEGLCLLHAHCTGHAAHADRWRVTDAGEVARTRRAATVFLASVAREVEAALSAAEAAERAAAAAAATRLQAALRRADGRGAWTAEPAVVATPSQPQAAEQLTFAALRARARELRRETAAAGGGGGGGGGGAGVGAAAVAVATAGAKRGPRSPGLAPAPSVVHARRQTCPDQLWDVSGGVGVRGGVGVCGGVGGGGNDVGATAEAAVARRVWRAAARSAGRASSGGEARSGADERDTQDGSGAAGGGGGDGHAGAGDGTAGGGSALEGRRAAVVRQLRRVLAPDGRTAAADAGAAAGRIEAALFEQCGGRADEVRARRRLSGGGGQSTLRWRLIGVRDTGAVAHLQHCCRGESSSARGAAVRGARVATD